MQAVISGRCLNTALQPVHGWISQRIPVRGKPFSNHFRLPSPQPLETFDVVIHAAQA